MGAQEGEGGAMDAELSTVPAWEAQDGEEGKPGAVDAAKVAEQVAAARALAAGGQRAQAIDALLAVEKAGRVAEDAPSTLKACTAILEVRGERVEAGRRWARGGECLRTRLRQHHGEGGQFVRAQRRVG